jgi:transposase
MEGTTQFTDGITAGVEERKQRGIQIAAVARIERKGKCYLVPSVTNPKATKYEVAMLTSGTTCTCPDFETRGCKCKHIYAVECVIQRESSVSVDADGVTTETIQESVTVTKTRKTYPQNWPAYNEAQTNEKREFQRLLHDLCKDIQTPPQTGRGQRRIPMPDAIFAAVFKIYSTFSARRFTSDLCDAQAKGYISQVPHFNSVLNYLENPNLFPVLKGLIEVSALPLAAVESSFAVDSTGFTTCRFVRWYDVKYNRFTSEQQWIKAHLMCGVKTNVVTAIEIHGRDAGDAPQFPPLVATTHGNGFDIREASADKAYSSAECHNAIDRIGAVPFIQFKNNATGAIGGVYEKMLHYFRFRKDEFLQHYHQRSNAETTMMMIKSKFGDSLRSKTEPAQKNEALAKILCHNICCLISAMYELNIRPIFTEVTGCTTKQITAQQNTI